jgi:hypothetical protein
LSIRLRFSSSRDSGFAMYEMSLAAIEQFPEEAIIVGRLLLAYSYLEQDFLDCVIRASSVDLAVKTMFRLRGESQRLHLADAVARQPYIKEGLEMPYTQTLGDLSYARRIRNQYSHCSWHVGPNNELGFTNLEDLASEHIELSHHSLLHMKVIDKALLKKQEHFFAFVQNSLWWLRSEYETRARRLEREPNVRPSGVPRPPLSRSAEE